LLGLEDQDRENEDREDDQDRSKRRRTFRSGDIGDGAHKECGDGSARK
jgi:hypothetical protein